MSVDVWAKTFCKWLAGMFVAIVMVGCLATPDMIPEKDLVPEVQLPAWAKSHVVEDVPFASTWETFEDRIWLGCDMLAQNQADWRIEHGRLVCDSSAPGLRWVDVAARCLCHKNKRRVEMHVLLENGVTNTQYGAAGFTLGMKTGLMLTNNYDRSGKVGLFAGVTPSGQPVVERAGSAAELRKCIAEAPSTNSVPELIELVLTAMPTNDRYTLLLQSFDAASHREIARQSVWNVPEKLVDCHFGLGALSRDPAEKLSVAFAEWRVNGADAVVSEDAESSFGPIAGSWYQLNHGELQMLVQMMPVGRRLNVVKLQVFDDSGCGQWITKAQAEINPIDYTAEFKIKDFGCEQDWPYRVEYGESLSDGTIRYYYWSGTIASKGADIAGMVKVAPVESGYFRPGVDVNVFHGVPHAPRDVRDMRLLQQRYAWCFVNREVGRDRPSVGVFGDSMAFRRVFIEAAETADERVRDPETDWDSWFGADVRVICATDSFDVAKSYYHEGGGATEPEVVTTLHDVTGYIEADAAARTVLYRPLDGRGMQLPGKWPLKFKHSAAFDRGMVGYLPAVEFGGGSNGVVQVLDEDSGKFVYSVRAKGSVILPRVFSMGHYTLIAGSPESGTRKIFKNQIPLAPGKNRTLKIEL